MITDREIFNVMLTEVAMDWVSSGHNPVSLGEADVNFTKRIKKLFLTEIEKKKRHIMCSDYVKHVVEWDDIRNLLGEEE